MDVEALGKKDLNQYGFDSLEQLIRWRLYNKTGGGLMAELGSHQLDACSIFIGRGIHGKEEAVHPLSVSGQGYKLFYRDKDGKPNREVDDSVFVTFEFPGKRYPLAVPGKDKDGVEIVGKDKDDKVIVTYSSINSNSFEPYGECVMGSSGTLVTLAEQDVVLYPEAGRSTAVGVKTGGGAPVLDASASTGGGAVKAAATGQAALGSSGGPPSRGYREEMEHFAYCIRNWGEKGNKDRPTPRCDGRHAMADAIMALSSNLAMKLGVRIDFTEGNRSKWFEARENEGYNLDDVPENDPVLKPLLEKKS
jgi:predicted dehydrogenase